MASPDGVAMETFNLHPELIGSMRLALADALDLRCVQGIALAPALAPFLRQHAARQAELPGEHLAEAARQRSYGQCRGSPDRDRSSACARPCWRA